MKKASLIMQSAYEKEIAAMDKLAVQKFFDACAPDWDAGMVRSDAVIARIFDGARIRAGCTVLDVACGTGVLFSDYLARGVKRVTAIDLSPEMVKIAAQKAAGKPIEVICGDAEEYDFAAQFDCVMVYNAFPHFPDPARAVSALARLVAAGGTLTVAHGMSFEKLRAHHAGRAAAVSVDLPDCEALAALFEPYFDVTVKCSDDVMYQVTGRKK